MKQTVPRTIQQYGTGNSIQCSVATWMERNLQTRGNTCVCVCVCVCVCDGFTVLCSRDYSTVKHWTPVKTTLKKDNIKYVSSYWAPTVHQTLIQAGRTRVNRTGKESLLSQGWQPFLERHYILEISGQKLITVSSSNPFISNNSGYLYDICYILHYYNIYNNWYVILYDNVILYPLKSENKIKTWDC